MSFNLPRIVVRAAFALVLSQPLFAQVVFESGFEGYRPPPLYASIHGYVFNDIDDYSEWPGLTLDLLLGDGSYSGADQRCLGNGAGIFSCADIAGQGNGNSYGVASGDVNNDGFLDAVFARSQARSRVCLGNGAGVFTCSDVSADETNTLSVALGDVNRDGNLDAVFAKPLLNNQVCLGDGLGGFSCSVVPADISRYSYSVVLGYVNGDAFLDAIFLNGAFGIEERDEVCLGNGMGGFSCADMSTATYSSIDAELADINGDGFLDAVIATINDPNLACLGDGSGSFSCSTVDVFPNNYGGVAIGLFDGDAFIDAVFASWGQDRMCLGDGAGGFTCSYIPESVNPDYGSGVEAADFNQDGFLDAVFSNSQAPDRMCLGDGMGNLSCSDVAGNRQSADVGIAHIDGSPEPGLAGITVTLEGDIDDDGMPDMVDTTTDGSGAWGFEGLAPGDYTVTVATPADRVITTPTFFNVTVAEGEEHVAVAGQAGLLPGDPRFEVVVGPDLLFGYAAGSIHGHTFDDSNGNGIDDGEPRVTGVEVLLSGSDGGGAITPRTALTGAGGQYDFTGLLPGTYTVTVSARPGWTGTTATSHPITLGVGEEHVAEAGQANLPPGDPHTEVVDGGLAFGASRAGSIHGYAFEDLNGNGVDDEEPRLAGVTFTLTGTDGLGNPVGPTPVVGDAQGVYEFTGLAPGDYTVTESVPATYTPTTPTVQMVSVSSGIESVAALGLSMAGGYEGVFITLPDTHFGVGMTFGPDGNLYVAVTQGGYNDVLRYDGTSGAFIDVFAEPDGCCFIRDLVFGPDGDLYVTDTANRIQRFDGTSGAALGVFASGGSSLVAMAFGPDGDLYATDSNQVLRFDGVSGEFLGVFVPPGSGGLLNPASVLFGADGNLYVVERSLSQVLRYDGTSGFFIDVFASGGGLDFPGDAMFGPDGNFFVVSAGNSDAILRFDGMTGAFIDNFASGDGLDAPARITFNADGELLVRSNTIQVRRYRGPTTEVLDTSLRFGNQPP